VPARRRDLDRAPPRAEDDRMSEEKREGTGPPPGPPSADGERLVNRVVVARNDGQRFRGYVYDFNADQATFHIFPSGDPGEEPSDKLRLVECKAIYFVRSLTGNPHFQEDKEAIPEPTKFGRAFQVTFNDGERLRGTVEFYNPSRKGFYLFPADPRSNSLRIFILKAACREVRPLGTDDEARADRDWTAPDPCRYPMEKRVEVVLRLARGEDAKKLSLEVLLPVPIIEHWRAAFLAGGGRALTDEALAQRAHVLDPSTTPQKPDKIPVDRRVEAVVRTIARQDEGVVSQVFLAPLHRIAEWRDAFIEGGSMAVRTQAVEEGTLDPDVLRGQYEHIVAHGADEEGDRDDLLDSIDDLLNEDPKK
jgi:hypothetical protein